MSLAACFPPLPFVEVWAGKGASSPGGRGGPDPCPEWRDNTGRLWPAPRSQGVPQSSSKALLLAARGLISDVLTREELRALIREGRAGSRSQPRGRGQDDGRGQGLSGAEGRGLSRGGASAEGEKGGKRLGAAEGKRREGGDGRTDGRTDGREGGRDIVGRKRDTRALGGLKPLTVVEGSPTHSSYVSLSFTQGKPWLKSRKTSAVDARNQKQDLCGGCPSREAHESNGARLGQEGHAQQRRGTLCPCQGPGQPYPGKRAGSGSWSCCTFALPSLSREPPHCPGGAGGSGEWERERSGQQGPVLHLHGLRRRLHGLRPMAALLGTEPETSVNILIYCSGKREKRKGKKSNKNKGGKKLEREDK